MTGSMMNFENGQKHGDVNLQKTTATIKGISYSTALQSSRNG
jgi:hypothetical protein